MPLTDKQKEALKEMTDEERAEFLDVLGIKSGGGDSSLAKTVEILQKEVADLKKTRKPRETQAPVSWFDRVFGGN